MQTKSTRSRAASASVTLEQAPRPQSTPPALRAVAARDVAVPDPPAAVPTLDAHGFDPDDYDWLPVPRQRRRSDGWTVPAQRGFIAALADTGSVTDAARDVGMSVKSCYALRRAPDAAGFARAWDAAMEQAGKALLDLAFERIIHGEDIPILNREGQRIGGKRRYSEKLTMFMLRGFFPDRFGAAAERGQRTVTQPPAIPPVEAALAALGPVVPAAPHKLMPPDALAEFIAAEAFNAAEEERFRRDYPEAAAREDAGVPRRATAPASAPAPDLSWEAFAEREASAEAKRGTRRARRPKD